MFKADRNQKSRVIQILTESFENNKSVNYIVKQDVKRKERITALMDYSFEICYMFGVVYLSNDQKACALVLYPEQKKISFRSLLLDVQLVLNAIGLTRAGKAMNRESIIKSNYPTEPIYYLWFLGVDPSYQHMGIASKLLKEVIKDSLKQEKPIYLETSTTTNIPWYQKFDFSIYKELNFSYTLFLLYRGKEIPLP